MKHLYSSCYHRARIATGLAVITLSAAAGHAGVPPEQTFDHSSVVRVLNKLDKDFPDAIDTGKTIGTGTIINLKEMDVKVGDKMEKHGFMWILTADHVVSKTSGPGDPGIEEGLGIGFGNAPGPGKTSTGFLQSQTFRGPNKKDIAMMVVDMGKVDGAAWKKYKGIEKVEYGSIKNKAADADDHLNAPFSSAVFGITGKLVISDKTGKPEGWSPFDNSAGIQRFYNEKIEEKVDDFELKKYIYDAAKWEVRAPDYAKGNGAVMPADSGSPMFFETTVKKTFKVGDKEYTVDVRTKMLKGIVTGAEKTLGGAWLFNTGPEDPWIPKSCGLIITPELKKWIDDRICTIPSPGAATLALAGSALVLGRRIRK
ncbi:MAG: hypothetical protein IT435_17950 [Phycisphaerales bacterium]|nr:hypothetical protein [Phycisphaerales bacterium]